MAADLHGPTMLCVNVDAFVVESSGKRCTSCPSFGGLTTVKTTDWFRWRSLSWLVVA